MIKVICDFCEEALSDKLLPDTPRPLIMFFGRNVELNKWLHYDVCDVCQQEIQTLIHNKLRPKTLKGDNFMPLGEPQVNPYNIQFNKDNAHD